MTMTKTNADILLKLTRARAALLIEQPFFGTLALHLKLIPKNDMPMKTLAVDGRHIFYDENFIRELDFDLVKSALAHEVGHCVFQHIGRRGSRNPQIWNKAGDYVINDMIKDAGFTLGENWLYNPSFKGMTSDQIYDILRDNEGGEGGGGGSGDPLCDVMDGDPSENEVMGQEWRVATIQAATAAKASGKLPTSMQRFVEQAAAPKVDWRSELRRFITQVAKGDYTWSRPNRRYIAHGLILPSLYSEHMGSLVAVSDDSGSIDDRILAAMSAEIDAIAAAVQPEKIIHISCDARINHVGEFGQGEPFKMVSKGGGGTDFNPPFEYVEEHAVAPACLVYLTDGYGPFPDAPPPYPVLWCMTTDVQPPWGEVLRIEM